MWRRSRRRQKGWASTLRLFAVKRFLDRFVLPPNAGSFDFARLRLASLRMTIFGEFELHSPTRSWRSQNAVIDRYWLATCAGSALQGRPPRRRCHGVQWLATND